MRALQQIEDELRLHAVFAGRVQSFDHLSRVNPEHYKLHARIDELLVERDMAVASPPKVLGLFRKASDS